MYLSLNGKEARTYPSWKINMSLKMGPSQNDISSSGDMLVFGRVKLLFFFVLGILHPYRRSNRFLDCRSEMPTSLVRALSPFLHVHRALVEFSRHVNFTRRFDMFLMACLTNKWNDKMSWMGWHDEWHLATLHNKESDVWIQKSCSSWSSHWLMYL